MRINFWFWFRALAMTLGLVATIIGIRQLDRTKKPESRNQAKAVNLCPTRVNSITATDGTALVQEGMAWYRKINGQMEELDPLAVEKWFGRHCVLTADPADTAAAPGTPVLTLAFVSGAPEILFAAGNGIYTWMGRAFQSAELEEAMQSLKNLPIRLRPSR